MPHPPLGVEEIDRKYEILEKLGEGGMGAIYKVRHRLLEEFRVIKLIRSELQGRDELQARFLREAKVSTQLRHPNIAQMFDFSVGEDGTAYIVMEFIDGRNLAELLDEVAWLPLGAAVELGGQCLKALGYLHDKQVVHRDIAPDTIMMVRDETGGTAVKLRRSSLISRRVLLERTPIIGRRLDRSRRAQAKLSACAQPRRQTLSIPTCRR